jgi:hypothetical protein
LTSSGDTGSYVQAAVETGATLETVSGKIDGLWTAVSGARSEFAGLRGIHRSLNIALRKTDQALSRFLRVVDQMREEMRDWATLSRALPIVLSIIDEEE